MALAEAIATLDESAIAWPVDGTRSLPQFEPETE
jgi:hypothetical protein